MAEEKFGVILEEDKMLADWQAKIAAVKATKKAPVPIVALAAGAIASSKVAAGLALAGVQVDQANVAVFLTVAAQFAIEFARNWLKHNVALLSWL